MKLLNHFIIYSVHFFHRPHDFLYTLVSSFGLVSGRSRCKKSTVLHYRLHYIDFLQSADSVQTSVFVRTLAHEPAFVSLAHLLVADKTALPMVAWMA